MRSKKAKRLTIVEIKRRVGKMPLFYVRGLAAMYMADMSAVRCSAHFENCDRHEFLNLGAETEQLAKDIEKMRPVYEELKDIRFHSSAEYTQIKRWNRMVKRQHAVLKKLMVMAELPHIKDGPA